MMVPDCPDLRGVADHPMQIFVLQLDIIDFTRVSSCVGSRKLFSAHVKMSAWHRASLFILLFSVLSLPVFKYRTSQTSSVARACVEVPHLIVDVVHAFESREIFVGERTHKWV